MSALCLVLLAGYVHLQYLPALEQAIEVDERHLHELERRFRRQQGAFRPELDAPVDTRQRLLARFPGEEALNGELGTVLALADEAGLRIANGDYRVLAGKDGLFDRYVLNVPVRGQYLAIRQYVARVRSALPDLAVDDMVVQRAGIDQDEVDAQLRFILFGRRKQP